MIREYQKGYVDDLDRMPFEPPSDVVGLREYESGYQDANEAWGFDMFGLSLRADEPVRYEELKEIELMGGC